MWLGKLLKMVVQDYHGSFSKEVEILLIGGFSSALSMDMVFALELDCIGVNGKKRFKNLQRWKRKDVQSPEMLSIRITKRWFCNNLYLHLKNFNGIRWVTPKYDSVQNVSLEVSKVNLQQSMKPNYVG